MYLSLILIVLTCLEKKSDPKITSLFKFSTTYKVIGIVMLFPEILISQLVLPIRLQTSPVAVIIGEGSEKDFCHFFLHKVFKLAKDAVDPLSISIFKLFLNEDLTKM
ncbi:hypothetical protein DMUE_5098 [Dictyocoela muelleri]|nr:hypothetical protein DMUE_5098 [Dictyocoela muelleri]